MLFALSGVLRWLSSSFSLFGGLLLGAALGPAAPALRLVLRRKRLRKRPPKPRSSRLRYNERLETALMGTSRWVISTLRSKRPWGQKKIPDLFFPTRGKMRLGGKVYQSYWTGNRLRPIVDRSRFGASFFGIMRFKLRPGSQNSDLSVRILRWHSLGRGLISAPQRRMSAYPPIADINGYGAGRPLLTHSGHLARNSTPPIVGPHAKRYAPCRRILHPPDIRGSAR